MSTAATQAQPAPRISQAERAIVKETMDKLRINHPWSYYTTLVLEDFSKLDTPILSFWTKSRGDIGLSRTNIAQPGQIPEAFRCYGVSVRVAISVYDNPRIFELITNWSSINLMVGSDEMIVGPLVQFPAGGGVTGMIEAGWVTPPAPGAPLPPSGDARFPGKRSGGDPSQGPPQTAESSGPLPVAPPERLVNVLTNGVPHRSNMYLFANDPILIKKGSNISTELHIDRSAWAQLRALAKPELPGVLIQLSLEGRRNRSAAYGQGG
jgi:hypothetical protein